MSIYLFLFCPQKRREENEMWNKLKSERTTQRHSQRIANDSRKRRFSEEDINESKDKKLKTSDRKPDNYWLKKLMTEEEKLSNER